MGKGITGGERPKKRAQKTILERHQQIGTPTIRGERKWRGGQRKTKENLTYWDLKESILGIQPKRNRKQKNGKD